MSRVICTSTYSKYIKFSRCNKVSVIAVLLALSVRILHHYLHRFDVLHFLKSALHLQPTLRY